MQEGKPDENIDFYWADVFPIRTPNVLKAALAEPELCDALCEYGMLVFLRFSRRTYSTDEACWERKLNMSDDKVLKDVIAEAGHNAEAILATANSDKIKQELRARTKEAKDIGICGVPTYRVFRRQLGQKD